jgi:hypothetical protein
MEPAARRRLGDIFIERGLISDHQLQEALAQQRETGAKLGEILVQLGFVTRICLAGVISEQWDDLRVGQGRKTAEPETRRASSPESSAESELREQLKALTKELADRERRIAQHEATIAALLAARSGPAAA